MGSLNALNHITHYRYDRPVTLGPQTIRLRPAPHTRSHIQSYTLRMTPAEHFIHWHQDPFGNHMAQVVFPGKVSEFRVEVDLVTNIQAFNPFDFFLEDYARNYPFTYDPLLKEALLPYLKVTENGARLMAYVNETNLEKTNVIGFLVSLNQRINQSLRYEVRLEPGVQSTEETLEKSSGSCRDMAWLACQLLRHLGLASRFVSGYLIQIEEKESGTGTEQDLGELHAWVEVYLPGACWLGLDPTSGLVAGETHIPLCCTPSPLDAAPISGTVEPCETDMTHSIRITRIEEEFSAAAPYTDAQWALVDAMGQKVDDALRKSDVRLTMGGEPTFISDKHRTESEWHIAALGGEKARLGDNLLRRLRDRMAPGGLLQYTQGKWYPGELLPRWAMNCYWRLDGVPLWQEETLLASPEESPGHTLATARAFAEKLAATLGIGASYVLPAREDMPYYLWKEQRLPMEGELLNVDTYEKSERLRVQELFDRQMGEAVAYMLPLQFSHTRKRWISNPWRFRSQHLVLLPGNSPAGLRLPLASLPEHPDALAELYPWRDPTELTDALPGREQLEAALTQWQASPADTLFESDPNGLIKNALSVEIRGGLLHVFLPPLVYAEHFIELLLAIEKTAAALDTALVLEGYSPPSDARLMSFSVTPDPGVIEVNVQPAAGWQELKSISTTVFEEAKNAGLSVEKFLLDGRQTGTGGGNHIVLGSAAAGDSPFLRRPDLLRSMISFWQNHPSLSYLFTGMYVGPTSQAPRIDEARHDSLYELEIAFRQVPEKGGLSPERIDRLFRNLLVDLTGNTHRAEFCIDKLFSPEHARGKLGLLELRGFEMTLHPQMYLVQALLIRAVVAHFWQYPYRNSLIRWGTYLHDAFMLPHYLREDFKKALRHLEDGGYSLPFSWFEPFFAFRFPSYGKVSIGGMSMELYMALEPWPVLGEETVGGGVSRMVDSSMERLQVTVKELHDPRYIVTCNQKILPLQPTAETGTYVAGVRFKAWQLMNGLHTGIPVHAPLTFDIFDTSARRSIGGCRYHVVHPGGTVYAMPPVNASEAEGRRLPRFEHAHTAGNFSPVEVRANPEFFCTLDLRHG